VTRGWAWAYRALLMFLLVNSTAACIRLLTQWPASLLDVLLQAAGVAVTSVSFKSTAITFMRCHYGLHHVGPFPAIPFVLAQDPLRSVAVIVVEVDDY
jgi:hypothetical protein